MLAASLFRFSSSGLQSYTEPPASGQTRVLGSGSHRQERRKGLVVQTFLLLREGGIRVRRGWSPRVGGLSSHKPCPSPSAYIGQNILLPWGPLRWEGDNR